MINLDVLAELIANIISFIFSFFGDIDLTPISEALETVTPFLKAALYILPAKTMAQIFAVVIAIQSLRVVIKTLKTLWEIIPIL